MRIVEKDKKFGYVYSAQGYSAADDERFEIDGVNKTGDGLGDTGSGGFNRIGIKDTGTKNPITWLMLSDGTMIQAEDSVDNYVKVSIGGNQARKCSINDETNGFDSKYPEQIGVGKYWRDKPGRFRRDGPGEPVTIDGKPYSIHITSFGITTGMFKASESATTTGPVGNDVKYILEAEPASVIDDAYNCNNVGTASFVSGDDAFGKDYQSKYGNATVLHNCYPGGDSLYEWWFDRVGDNFQGRAMFIAVPNTKRAVVDVAGLTWPDTLDGYHMSGKKVSPVTIQVTVDNDGAVGDVGTLTVKSATGSTLKTVKNMQGMVQTAVPLDDVWEQIPVGQTYIELLAGSGDAQSFPTRVYFEKANGSLEVKGKPQEVDQKPVQCTIISAVVLGDSAEVSWQVCNNANDTSPAWEEYTGPNHVFQNESKEVGTKWAVNWRCAIDGGGSTSRSELVKQVGMAVL